MDSRPTNQDFIGELAADILACLRFCTRLPFPVYDLETDPHAASVSEHARMLPVAGAVIGAIAALVLWLAARVGLPPSLAALSSLAVLVCLTGALHEDGLADFADALGGWSREQRLTIMKDSRIGTFGTLALIMSVLARVLSIAVIARHNLALAAMVLIATAAVSRTLALMPLRLLPPARDEGAGFSAAAPQQPVLLVAACCAFVVGLLPLFAGAGFGRCLIAMILSCITAYGVTRLAERLIDGQTGDVAGATQQLAELCAYLVFAAWP